MRLLFSLVFLIGGICLCLFDGLAHAIANASWETAYRNELQLFPVKQTYTKAELADAAWQVWTNRASLPEQASYTVPELKEAVVRRLLGTHQDSCDRREFESGIARVMGYQKQSDKGKAVVGFIAMLAGTFLLGGLPFRRNSKK
jgi:hypothetical protein